MGLFKSRTSAQANARKMKSVINKLDRTLDRQACAVLKSLRNQTSKPATISALFPALRKISRLRGALQFFHDMSLDRPHQVHGLLHRSAQQLTKALECESASNAKTRSVLVDALHAVVHAEQTLAVDVAPSMTPGPRRVSISAELLYATFDRLFPAERMFVISGQTEFGVTHLQVPYDVTGIASAVNVQADAKLLSKALVAMAITGAHLAGWFHSHPGTGVHSTSPSEIDRRQYTDWMGMYSQALLCAIMVRDGYVRFWGKNAEQKLIDIEVIGPGVKKEDSNGLVFKLTER